MNEDDADACMVRAERLASQAGKLPPTDFETVIHSSYYAMYHAAGAALLAVEGSASTKHGRISKAFAEMAHRFAGEEGERWGAALGEAYDFRVISDYGPGARDLSREAAALISQLSEFLAFRRSLVEKQRKRG